ncbi:PHP domain-containing protein [Candidatus Bathyarchaeota archaeon]|nr:MAG: PHP domain-containing protein [Candidatus Hecatellales archaeon]RLI34336.1 MAG: PHP domain-containing protein [Candidatus Bathyarchaeota archaeon]
MENRPVRELGGRIDLHMHSLLSDGVLLPSEIARRADSLGFKAIAITDHVDHSNLEWVLKRIQAFRKEFEREPLNVEVYVGVEITHVPPSSIPILASKARRLGAQLIVVHGETIVEPVASGTNRSAVNSADVDILAHPGLLTLEDCEKAASNGVYLELSTRAGHSLTNGHVARLAEKTGAKLLVNTDFHAPEDFVSQEEAYKVALGAGLNPELALKAVKTWPEELLKKIRGES